MKRHQKIIFITLGLLGILGMLALLWGTYHVAIQSFWNQTFDRQRLIDLLRHQGKHNAVLFVAVIALGSAIPGLPIAAIAVLAGVCFGRWPGFAINVVGIVLGTLLAIQLLSHFPHRVQPSKLRALTDRLKTMRHPRLGLMIGYAVPMLPTILVNYAALELHLGLRDRVICIFIGSLPVSFLYAFGGDELLSGDTKTAVVAIVLAAVLIALYEVIRRDQRAKATNATKVTDE